MKKYLHRILAFVLILTLSLFPNLGLGIGQTQVQAAKKVQLNYSDEILIKGKTLTLKLTGTTKKVTYSSSNKKIATVNKKGVVTAKANGTAVITAKVSGKKYECKVTVKTAALSRAEWVDALLKQMGVSISKGVVCNCFSDISGNKYKKSIQTAYDLDILPKEKDGLFHPNAPVTREYAAVTAVRGIGLDVSQYKTLKCSDKKKLSYVSEDAAAIDVKMLSLKGKKFEPQKELTKKEKSSILKVVKKYVDSTKIKKNTYKVTYQDDVVEKKDTSFHDSYISVDKENQMTMSVPAGVDVSAAKVGEVFIYENTNQTSGAAVKVESVTVDANGQTIIKGSVPELGEVIKSVDIEDEIPIDMTKFVPNEAVVESIELFDAPELVSDTKASDSGMVTNLYGAPTPTDVEMTINQDGVKFALKKDSGVEGSIEITYPTLTTKIKSSGEGSDMKISSMYVCLEEKAKLELKVSKKIKEKKIYLGHVQVPLQFGFNAWIAFYFVIDAEGSLSISCEFTSDASINYYNEHITTPKVIPNLSCNNIEGSVDIKSYLEMSPQITWLGYWSAAAKEVKGCISIADINLDAGAGINLSGKGKFNSKPKVCVDMMLYPYIKIGFCENEYSILGKVFRSYKLTTEWTISDSGNPLKKLELHIEDGKVINGECSHTKGDCKLIFMANGGGNITPSYVYRNKGDMIGILPTPIRSGYTFEGWYTKQSGGEKIDYDYIVPDAMMLYAHWKESPIMTISFDANGGNLVGSEQVAYKVGKKYKTFPAVRRQDFEFDGWFTQKDGGRKILDTATVTRDNGTLYAHWTSLDGADGEYSALYIGEQLMQTAVGTIVLEEETYSTLYSIKLEKAKLVIDGGIALDNKSGSEKYLISKKRSIPISKNCSYAIYNEEEECYEYYDDENDVNKMFTEKAAYEVGITFYMRNGFVYEIDIWPM